MQTISSRCPVAGLPLLPPRIFVLPTRIFVLMVALLLAVLFTSPVTHASPLPAPQKAVDLLPEEVLGWLTVHRGSTRIPELEKSKLFQSFRRSKTYRQLESNPEYLKAKLMIFGLSTTVSLHPSQALGALLGREAALGMGIQKGQKEWIAVAILDQPKKVDQMLATIRLMASGGSETTSKHRKIHELGSDAFYSRFGSVLALSSSKTLIRECRARQGKPVRKKRRHLTHQTEKIDLGIHVDLERIRELAGGTFPPTKSENALAALFFGGAQDLLSRASTVTGGAKIVDDGISLSARIPVGDTIPDRVTSFFPGDSATFLQLDLPRTLGRIGLQRDLSGLWEGKKDLIPEGALRGLLNFANTFTTLLGSLDFGEDLLPALGTPIQLVSNRSTFSDMFPAPELPAFALVVPLRAAEKMRTRLETATLQALSIINLNNSQEGRPSYMVDRENYGSSRITFAEWEIPEGAKTPLDIRHNFSPSTCVTNGYFVIGSTRQLTREIIDSLSQSGSSRPKKVSANTLLEVDGAGLHHILTQNRDLLADQKMVEEDLSASEAKAEIEGLLSLAGLAESLHAELELLTGHLQLSVSLKVKP